MNMSFPRPLRQVPGNIAARIWGSQATRVSSVVEGFLFTHLLGPRRTPLAAGKPLERAIEGARAIEFFAVSESWPLRLSGIDTGPFILGVSPPKTNPARYAKTDSGDCDLLWICVLLKYDLIRGHPITVV